MTRVSFGNGIRLEQVREIEVCGEQVRVTFVDGQRKFVEGKDGFELYRRWKERAAEMMVDGGNDDGIT